MRSQTPTIGILEACGVWSILPVEKKGRYCLLLGKCIDSNHNYLIHPDQIQLVY